MYIFDPNNVVGVNGGAEVLFGTKELLKAAGYGVLSSGDGTTLFAGDGITHAGVGAGGMNNSRSWVRVQAPAAMAPRREWILLRGSTGDRFAWIQVSAEDGFVGGAPTGDTPPTALDAANIVGIDTTGGLVFPAASTFTWHAGADDAAPFSWYAIVMINGTAVADGSMIFEPMAPGSFPVGDDDPAVYYAGPGAWSNVSVWGAVGGGPSGWYQKDLGGEAFVRMIGFTYSTGGAGQIVPSGTGTNPYDGDDNLFPVPYGRSAIMATQIGWKGFGASLRWLGTIRANMSTLSVLALRDKVVVGPLALPWNGSVPVI